MKSSGFYFLLSDDSKVFISPNSGMEKCSAVYKGLEILVDVEGGSFSSSNIESEKNSLGVKEFKRVDLDDPKDDKSGGVDAKGCRVSGCCCNCGGGWIC